VYVFPYQKALEGAGRVAPPVEYLPSKQETLSSNPVLQKFKKRKRKETSEVIIDVELSLT
jgi:hypothetical protein